MNIQPETSSQYIPMEIVRRNPNLPWNRDDLSRNRGITVDDVFNLQLSNATGRYSIWELSQVFPVDYILSDPDRNWNWNAVMENRSLRAEQIPATYHYHGLKPEHGDKNTKLYRQFVDAARYHRQDNMSLSVPEGVDVEDIARRYYAPGFALKRLPIDYWLEDHDGDLGLFRDSLLHHPEITLEIAQRIMPLNQYHYGIISAYVPIEDVRRNRSLPWSRRLLSRNPNITLNDVLNLELPNATEDWNWEGLSQIIPMDDIRANPGLPWHGNSVLQNPEVTIADAEAMLSITD